MYNKPGLQVEIDEKFNHDLFRDVSSVYGKRNSQRQFYTVPSTTIPNNQTSFANGFIILVQLVKKTLLSVLHIGIQLDYRLLII